MSSPATSAKRSKRLTPFLLLLPALICLSPFLAGLITVAYESLAWGSENLAGIAQHYVHFFAKPLYRTYLARSFVATTYATPITLLLAYPVAYMMVHARSRVRSIFTAVLVVQLLSGYVVRGYAIMIILGTQGLLNRLLMFVGLTDEPIRFLFNQTGVLIGLVTVAFPLMVFPLQSVLQNLPQTLPSAAQTLGATPGRAF